MRCDQKSKCKVSKVAEEGCALDKLVQFLRVESAQKSSDILGGSFYSPMESRPSLAYSKFLDSDPQ